jgi:hypothetical protein
MRTDGRKKAAGIAVHSTESSGPAIRTRHLDAVSRGWREDLISALLGLVLVLGMLLDGRAHKLGILASNGDSLFSPWHAVLYSGFILLALWVVHIQRRDPGRVGYRLSLLGAAGFLLSGFADLLWHLAFGFENALEAGTSPPHVALFVSGLLLVSGPIRSPTAFMKQPAPTLRQALPQLLSTAAVTASVVAWVNVLLTPLPWGAPAGRMRDLARSYGEIVVYWDLVLLEKMFVGTFLICGASLFLLRRWRPPPGTFTLLFLIVGGLSSMEDNWAVAAITPAFALAGILTDLLLSVLHRRAGTAPRKRLFVAGAAIPLFVWGCYIGLVAATLGLRWSHTMWSGTILLTSLAGVGLTCLIADMGTPGRIEETGPDVVALPDGAAARRPAPL